LAFGAEICKCSKEEVSILLLFKSFISLSLVSRLVTRVYWWCWFNSYPSLFVQSMLILCLNTQCLHYEHVLVGKPSFPRPFPLEHFSMLIYYVYSINAYNMFVSPMLILYLSTQCLYYEHVLGEGDPPPPDPLPLKHYSVLSYISQSILISIRAKRSKIVKSKKGK
jgi:hypothetical protein